MEKEREKEWEIKGDWLIIQGKRIRLSNVIEYKIEQTAFLDLTLTKGKRVFKLGLTGASDLRRHLDHHFFGMTEVRAMTDVLLCGEPGEIKRI